MIFVPQGALIALVDDDDVDRMIIRRVIGLSHLDNPVVEYSSGTSFVDQLQQDGDDPSVSLVLMDINMPGMTGLEALEHIRTVCRLPDLPIVVMLTSSEAKNDIERAAELGAHGYLVKETGIEPFVARINETFTNQD